MENVVPDAWKPKLREYIRERCGEDRDRLSAYDFSGDQNVSIQFPDGSHAFFRWAFAISDESAGEVAVFTEHCGYHVFPIGGTTRVEILRPTSPQTGR